jgi:hypothetical protein
MSAAHPTGSYIGGEIWRIIKAREGCDHAYIRMKTNLTDTQVHDAISKLKAKGCVRIEGNSTPRSYYTIGDEPKRGYGPNRKPAKRQQNRKEQRFIGFGQNSPCELQQCWKVAIL